MRSLSSFFITLLVLLAVTEVSVGQMFWNQAAQYAGSNTSYMAVPNSSSLNITGSFTLEAWIKPNQTILARGIFGKGSTLGTAMDYGMRLTGTGRITLITNGNGRLTSRSSNTIPNGAWTHVCGTYNSSTNAFAIYINGQLDTSSTVAGAAPVSNTDSLFVGITGSSTPFSGQLDEVRIWNRQLSSTEVLKYFRTSLGTSSGKYSGLVLSITFQQNEANGSTFAAIDWSGNANNGAMRNITAVNLTNVPSRTIAMNDCLEFDGVGDYAAANDDVENSPTAALTISAWVYPRSNSNAVIVHKGNPGGGAGTNYRLGLLNGKLLAGINGNFGYLGADSIPVNRWTHVAFAYSGSSGAYYFYKNGKLSNLGAISSGNMANGIDSFYVGGTPSLSKFNGYIDEIKLISDVKFEETIAQSMFRSSEESLFDATASYNLDGYTHSNYDAAPQLHFRFDAGFAHAGSTNNQPVSPMNRSDASDFQGGFYLKTSERRIPETGDVGNMITDSITIPKIATITDVDLYIALNHTYERDLIIRLAAPNGSSVVVYDGEELVPNSDNIVTIFDDNSPYGMIEDSLVQLCISVKPSNPINSAFSGGNSLGVWRLVIGDGQALDTGRLYAWGLRINNSASKEYVVRSRQFIEGFYRTSPNLTITDTIRYKLRNTQSPYAIVDSAKGVISTSGYFTFYPTAVSSGAFYFLSLQHRNSVETWSNVVKLDALTFTLDFDFTSQASAAYGSNQVLIDTSPDVRYGIYSGDVNQSGDIDATDLALIDNDALSFASGYIATDINGDNFTDASDYALADNNALNFVGSVLPPVIAPGNDEAGTVDSDNVLPGSDPAVGVNESTPFIRVDTFEGKSK